MTDNPSVGPVKAPRLKLRLIAKISDSSNLCQDIDGLRVTNKGLSCGLIVSPPIPRHKTASLSREVGDRLYKIFPNIAIVRGSNWKVPVICPLIRKTRSVVGGGKLKKQN